MFSFFKKEKYTGLLPVSTEMHCHVLPGIDDGAADIEASLTLIRGLQQIGIKKIIATPHIISDTYPNTPATIGQALEKTQDACNKENIDIELSAAAEYMLDDNFLNLLKKKEKLLTLADNYILTEQSYASPTQNLSAILFEIITNGYKPILAHPERYLYYHNNYKIYHQLADMGFLLQVNMLSISGYYGGAVAKASKYILKNNLAPFVGSDVHHNRHLQMLQQKETLHLLNKYCNNRIFNQF